MLFRSDLWDVNIAGALGNDSQSARFAPEGFQETYVRFVKGLTTKPVVGVGRFTSPDAMLRQIKEGILDFIGAARPSIADPFLPAKLRDGRDDDVRECIGCNICRSANNEAVPLRCTQNPTMGEEWRRRWHPEIISPRSNEDRILVVGAGPAGLEAALSLGRRGHPVMLAEASRELGGRLLFESKLPGLATWIRVRDYRQHQLSKLPNVEIYRESQLLAEDIAALDAAHVVLATGSRWRRDGIGTAGVRPLPISAQAKVFTPDDLTGLTGPVLIYDDDNYAIASALAEQLHRAGHPVTYVTSQPLIAAWTVMTDEQYLIEKRFRELEITAHVSHMLTHVSPGTARFDHSLSRAPVEMTFGSLIMVTGRVPRDDLYGPLVSGHGEGFVTRIGDCLNPSHIADAVFGGHRFAQEYGEPRPLPALRRERPDF